MYKDFAKQAKLLDGVRVRKVKGSITNRDEPDYYCCVLGFTVMIEFKQRGKKARPAQLAALRKWQTAGARTAVCDTVAGAIAIINEVRHRADVLYQLEESFR